MGQAGFYDVVVAQKRILVVDDEPNLRGMIADALGMGGYVVDEAADGYKAAEILRHNKFDLLIADINMPRMDGYELVEALRRRGDTTPVIFLSARNERPDITKGFRVGADDYVTKPFGLEELALRVAAVLRRTSLPDSDTLTCGPVEVNESAHIVTVENRVVDLSPTEYRVLVYLMENKNKVLTKYSILDRVWGIDFTDTATVVDTYISYLRKKIHTPSYQGIKTVRGVGFEITDKP